LKRCTYLHEGKGEGVGGGVIVGDPEDGHVVDAWDGAESGRAGGAGRIISGEVWALGGGGGGRDGGGRRYSGRQGGVVVVRDAIGRRVGERCQIVGIKEYQLFAYMVIYGN
jgi:hypothetical protein